MAEDAPYQATGWYFDMGWKANGSANASYPMAKTRNVYSTACGGRIHPFGIRFQSR